MSGGQGQALAANWTVSPKLLACAAVGERCLFSEADWEAGVTNEGLKCL